MNSKVTAQPISHRRAGRIAAFLAFLGTGCVLIGAIYVAALALQRMDQPSPLAIPLIGSWVAFTFATVGFGAGLLVSTGSYYLWRCVVAAAVPIAVGALIAGPIGNMSPRDRGEWTANTVVVLILVISFLIPMLIRIRTTERAPK